ncbi:oligopeptide:H+ symporter [Gallaecimonas kandeliae]|uniref:peptide MFS transporter n=1 Tax=Gallaecimonas kandeliae TaxID=3029055 RepID=UPI0026482C64|nr:oligopeptide:H+ symporter [Gallaecimonas kandeliae]WKE65779.1 oligopeptide:H+ symporter [Gallaecimonas kandeliae]
MLDTKSKQLGNVAAITFWGQFATYTFNAILIVFMTMPLVKAGLGLSEHDAYLLYGVIQALGYILPVAGGYLADRVLGLRRSILYGSLLLALSFLALVLASYLFKDNPKAAFMFTYPLVPIGSSLLLGTASALIGRIYQEDDHKAKRGMTLYYITINLGSMLGLALAPWLLHSALGPMSVFLVAFAGKFLAWLNFRLRKDLYLDVIQGADQLPMTGAKLALVLGYVVGAYLVVTFLFAHPELSVYLISAGILFAIGLFTARTLKLEGEVRHRQLFAIYLLAIGFLFFVLYAQMNTSIILFTKNNSDLKLLGFSLYPSSFQLINPIAIVLIGSFISRFYKRYPRFNVPYQFPVGIFIGGIGMLVLYLAALNQHGGIVSGDYIGLSYLLLTVAELLVSALGLSMISLYCDGSMLGFAMGVWFLTTSLGNLASGELSEFVALPAKKLSPETTLPIYSHYYLDLALASLAFGVIFLLISKALSSHYRSNGIALP